MGHPLILEAQVVSAGLKRAQLSRQIEKTAFPNVAQGGVPKLPETPKWQTEGRWHPPAVLTIVLVLLPYSMRVLQA